MQAKLMFLHALSPLHAGTGQGVGAIDLPIAREKGTEIPIVPGSSLKGVLR
ncbi:type III-B CRISPR module RAMP protein Cmr4, partial [Candidatus Parcubacteria bacterium]